MLLLGSAGADEILLKGRTVDSHGVAVAGVVVSLYPTAFVDTTGADGRFEMGAISTLTRISAPAKVSSCKPVAGQIMTLSGRRVFSGVDPGLVLQETIRSKVGTGLYVQRPTYQTFGGITLQASTGFQLRFRKEGYASIDLDMPVLNLDMGDIILQKVATKLKVLQPNGGEVYHVGDTMSIKIEFNPGFDELYVPAMSLDGGSRWYHLLVDAAWSPSISDPVFRFVIPEMLPIDQPGAQQISVISDKCQVRVSSYIDQTEWDATDGFFSIVPKD